mmetsp:Transcript_52303/g.144890  ORF Transcript_52303/g.144890 Transcript_52303/m.144890 type:complete len:307 (-) Transcript_52303:108-1028(-)
MHHPFGHLCSALRLLLLGPQHRSRLICLALGLRRLARRLPRLGKAPLLSAAPLFLSAAPLLLGAAPLLGACPLRGLLGSLPGRLLPVLLLCLGLFCSFLGSLQSVLLLLLGLFCSLLGSLSTHHLLPLLLLSVLHDLFPEEVQPEAAAQVSHKEVLAVVVVVHGHGLYQRLLEALAMLMLPSLEHRLRADVPQVLADHRTVPAAGLDHSTHDCGARTLEGLLLLRASAACRLIAIHVGGCFGLPVVLHLCQQVRDDLRLHGFAALQEGPGTGGSAAAHPGPGAGAASAGGDRRAGNAAAEEQVHKG